MDCAPSPFTVKTNSWNPNPAYVGQIISSQVQGKFDPSSIDGGGSGQTFVVYTWSTAGVWYSPDGTAGTFEPCGSYAIGWQQGQADTTFSAQFFAPGQYLLEVSCVATVYSQSTGSLVASFSGTGYIGGSASDIDTSGGSTGHAHKAQGLKAHDGGGDGITVVPATVTFLDNSLIKLGMGAPRNYFKVITAIVTPSILVSTIGFKASNGEVNLTVLNADPATGLVTINVTAVSSTPVTFFTTGGNPDCNIIATDSSADTLDTVPVIVLVPTYCNEDNPDPPTISNTHYIYPDQAPADLGNLPKATKKGTTNYVTSALTYVNITIFDQFYNTLDSIYDGVNRVSESLTGSINVPSAIISYPSNTLSHGVIKDEVQVTLPVMKTDDSKIDSGWNNRTVLLDGYDNAISWYLTLPEVPQEIDQTLSVCGYPVTPTWARSYTLYKRNKQVGPPMSAVTETRQ